MPRLGWQARVTLTELTLGQSSDILLFLLENTVIKIQIGFRAGILIRKDFFFLL